MDSSKDRSSRKETYTHKNIDPEISTIGTVYIHHNNNNFRIPSMEQW